MNVHMNAQEKDLLHNTHMTAIWVLILGDWAGHKESIRNLSSEFGATKHCSTCQFLKQYGLTKLVGKGKACPMKSLPASSVAAIEETEPASTGPAYEAPKHGSSNNNEKLRHNTCDTNYKQS